MLDASPAEIAQPSVLPFGAWPSPIRIEDLLGDSVRLGEPVSSATSKVGDTVSATLADPVTIDGVQVLPTHPGSLEPRTAVAGVARRDHRLHRERPLALHA